VRREKAEQYAEAGLQRHREESARKDPDPPKAPRPDRLRASAPDTDEGRYVTALLDSWYAAQPSASLKDTQQILMAYSAQAHDQIKLGKDWAEVTEMAKTRVWGTLDDELEAADVLDEARFMAGM
jgi:hypothetical protein